jgi:hypothetical protein
MVEAKVFTIRHIYTPQRMSSLFALLRCLVSDSAETDDDVRQWLTPAQVLCVTANVRQVPPDVILTLLAKLHAMRQVLDPSAHAMVCLRPIPMRTSHSLQELGSIMICLSQM